MLTSTVLGVALPSAEEAETTAVYTPSAYVCPSASVPGHVTSSKPPL